MSICKKCGWDIEDGSCDEAGCGAQGGGSNLHEIHRLIEEEKRLKSLGRFIIKHYSEEERPIIKGNGFDGLEVGRDREEAQSFIDFINELIAVVKK